MIVFSYNEKQGCAKYYNKKNIDKSKCVKVKVWINSCH